jgi:transposase-like protein
MPQGRKVDPARAVRYVEEVERRVAAGATVDRACRETGIGKKSYHRWRSQYAGVDVRAAVRMRELERENAQLRRLVADMAVKIQALEDVVRGRP